VKKGNIKQRKVVANT